jgi:hypothetical protein
MTSDRTLTPLQEIRRLRAAACDPRLCRGDVAVLAVILSKYNNTNGCAYIGKNKLAEQAGLSPRNVGARTGKIEKTGHIQVERRGQRICNRYTLPPLLNVQSGDAGITNQSPGQFQSGDACIPSMRASEIQSGDAGVHQSGDAGVPDLGMPASPLLTCYSPSVLTPPTPAVRKRVARKSEVTLDEWLDSCEDPIPDGHRVHSYCREAGIPNEFVELAWACFIDRYSGKPKRYRDWAHAFLDHIKGGWLNVWRIDQASNEYLLTTAGLQLQRQLAALERAA